MYTYVYMCIYIKVQFHIESARNDRFIFFFLFFIQMFKCRGCEE